MATKGTQFGRTMQYFRSADLDEAQAALERATEVVGQRQDDAKAATAKPPVRRRTARQRSTAALAEASRDVAKTAETVNAGLL